MPKSPSLNFVEDTNRHFHYNPNDEEYEAQNESMSGGSCCGYLSLNKRHKH